MKGYMGKITFVDLTARKIWNENFDETFARKYLGGNGFAVRTLLNHVQSGVDPLGPDNVFIVCTGPLTGTLAHGSGRSGVVTKSPLTGYFMDSYFGGDFGLNLKQSGRDMVVALGKSQEPVILYLDDEQAELIPAKDLWGLSTKEAQDRLTEKLGQGISTLCCGPAGENLAALACCIGGRRAAGRGGTGAVLGSKNLKAISVRGSKDIQVADIKGLLKFYKENHEKFLGLKNLNQIGTPFLVKVINSTGGLGTHNWQRETWDRADMISGERLLENHFVRNDACFGCNIGGCTRISRSIKSPEVMTEGPEYETLFALGSNCGVDDLDVIIETDRLCDDYGLDTISYGGSIAFLMECFQRGLVSGQDTGGLDFSFGNGQTLLDCTHLTARREGIGGLIAQGVRAMSLKIGQGSERFAIHIKGLEPPGHSARALKSMGLGYAVSPRGGSHQDVRSGSEYSMNRDQRNMTDGKPLQAYNTANWTAVGDSMIVCRFCEGVFGSVLSQAHVDLINLTVGWDMTLDELERVGQRVHTMEKLFNCREGLRRKDETLPYRYLNEEIPDGNSKGLRTKPAELEQMLDQYYELRGWDQDGVPRKETLAELGLDDLLSVI